MKTTAAMMLILSTFTVNGSEVCGDEINRNLMQSEFSGLVLEDTGLQMTNLEAKNMLKESDLLGIEQRQWLVSLIQEKGTITRSYGNDAGLWLVFASRSDCRVLVIEKLIDN